MFVATSDSRNSCKASEECKTPKCIIENSHNGSTNCLRSNQNIQFPAINEVQKEQVPKDIRSETSRLNVSLPKLNQSKQRIDAGEPYANDFGFESGNIDASFVPCTNYRQFQLLNASSSESLQSSGTSSLSMSSMEDSSRRMKLLEKQMHLKEEKFEESQALKRWEFWMNEKKKMQDSLSKRLKRPTIDLLMQESDKYREVMEKKLMLWYSRIPEPDEQRGTPARWKPQLRLRNRKTQAQYCLIKSKLEQGERPELELVGLSVPIKQEKGLLPGEDFEDDKVKTAVRHVKKMHCKEERHCGSHEVNMDELVVVGYEIFNNGAKRKLSHTFENVPKIILPKESQEEPLKCSERKSVFCLAINDEEVKYEIGSDCCQDRDRMFVWNVDFGLTKAGSIAEKVFRVENRGTMAVRYDWLSPKNEQKISLNALQPRYYHPWFFFNKNSGFFLPGQIYNLKFYFHPQTSGIRKETWHLKTNPPWSKNVKFATITLSGVATEEFSTEPKFLEFYLEKRNQESGILDIINEVLYKVFITEVELSGIEYRSIFTEKQLFEYQNPNHHYHSKLVEELKGIFREIPCKVQTEWDLSIASLWHLIGAYKTGDDQSTSIAEVMKRSSELFRPNYCPERNQIVYRMSYGILCKMINCMEQDFVCLKSSVTEKITEPNVLGELEGASNSAVNIFSTEEETGEMDIRIPEINPINFMFFRNLFYLKVYRRICEAAEHIAGVIETRKFFEPWKKISYKPPKPSRRGKVCPAK